MGELSSHSELCARSEASAENVSAPTNRVASAVSTGITWTSGGENISSIEVEEALYRHPAVLTAAVVAQPDPKWGETPRAYVELKPGATVTEEELRLFCRQHMAGFKVPKAIVFGDLPKTSTGKIQKFALREQAKSASAIE